jgi:predicted enzyme related to lactoylglutathione lyase
MAITGAHALLYTSDPEAVRAVFRDVFGWRHVDAGHGWLIFALPPAELGVHPMDGPVQEGLAPHRVSLMCDDLEATMAELRDKGIEILGEPHDQGYGIVATIGLPGGLHMDLYQPRHPTAI